MRNVLLPSPARSRALAVIAMTAMTAASVFPGLPTDLARELVPTAEAATFVFSSRSRPLLDCGGVNPCGVGHWNGEDSHGPAIVLQGQISANQVLTGTVGGTIDWGGGAGLPNPSSCALGNGQNAIPKQVAMGQFFDASARVVPYRKPDGSFGPSGAFILNDISQPGGVRVPAGAVGVAFSYPDSDYGDNDGDCTVNLTVSGGGTTPPPPPVTPPPPPQGSGICSVNTTNLLSNGDFEQPTIVNSYNGNTWAVYGGGDSPGNYPSQPSIPGWAAQYPYQVELQRNTLFNSAAARGVQYAEVDAQGQIWLRQGVQTQAGATYEIRFAYSPRPGVGAQQMGVFVDGNRIGTASHGGIAAGTGLTWNCYSFRFTGNGQPMTVGFGSLNVNGAGNLMDNVSVTLVSGPPASSAPAGTVDLASDLTGLPSVVGPNLTYAVYSNNTKTGTSTAWGARRVFSSPNAGTRIFVQNAQGYCTGQNTATVTCEYPFTERPSNFGAVTELAVTTPSVCSGTFQISVATTSLVIQDSNDSNNRDTMSATFSCGSSAPASAGGGAQCSNGRDDDNDGRIDYPADPGCVSPSDNDEFNPAGGSSAPASAPASAGGAQCSNGRDDDNDGRIDYPADPGCVSPSDNDEFNPTTSSAPASVPSSTGGAQCSNGRDDDNDGRIDYPADPGCVSPSDNDEFNPTGGSSAPASVPSSTGGAQCSNGRDDDNDGRIDYPADPGCVSPSDNDEFNPAASSAPASSVRSSVGGGTQCSNGIDDDNDGRIDYPADPGCVSPSDNDEFNPTASSVPASSSRSSAGGGTQCSDGIDNDNDGRIDYPADPGCVSPVDNDEFNPTSSAPASSSRSSVGGAQCSDGIDNDNDGRIDYPADPGCVSPVDNDEFNPVASSSRASSVPSSSAQSSAAVADLSIVKTGPATITAGSVITYGITISNAGPGTTGIYGVVDTIPNGLTFNAGASSGGCYQTGQVIVCESQNLASGQSAYFSIAFNVPASFACTQATIQNVAVAALVGTDPNPSNNTSATVSTSVICAASSASSAPASSAPASSAGNPSLTIVKTVAGTVTAGSTVTYQFEARNNGTGQASSVRAIDFFIDAAGNRVAPPFVYQSFAGDVVTCAWSSQYQQVECQLGNMAPGAVKYFTLQFGIPLGTPCGSTVRNQADIYDADFRSVNWAHAQTTVNCPASSAASSVTASSVASSVQSSFGISSVPASSSQSSFAVQSSAISSSQSSFGGQSSVSSSAVSSQPANVGCIEIRKEAFNPSGAQLYPVPAFTFTLEDGRTATNDQNGIARFQNVLPGSRIVTEQLPSGWQQIGVVPVNGIAYVTPGQSCAVVTFRNQQTVQQQPSYTVTKTDSRSTASAGETLSYSITVTNTANVAATNVQVLDILPSQLAFIAASDNATVSGQTVTWTIGSIPAGQSRTLTLTAQIRNGTAPGTLIRNIAFVNGTSASGQDDTTVTGGGNRVEIDIDASEDEVEPGDELEYEIEVCNVSGQPIQNLQVTQILPDDVEVTDDDHGDEDDGVIRWTITLGANGCRTFDTAIELDDDYDDDEVRTTVLADGVSEEEVTDVDDGDEDDDDDDLDEDGLTIRKDASQNEVFPGGVVEYTLTVENDTGEDLEDLVVTDRITGAGFTIIDDGGADRSGNTLEWEIARLRDGQTKVFRYRISVDAGAYPGQIIRNAVEVETEDDDDDYGDEAGANVTVINNLPQTGFFGGTRGGNQHLRPYTGRSSAGLPLTAVLSVILAGLGTGAGMGLGRRFFLS